MQFDMNPDDTPRRWNGRNTYVYRFTFTYRDGRRESLISDYQADQFAIRAGQAMFRPRRIKGCVACKITFPGGQYYGGAKGVALGSGVVKVITAR